MLSSAAVRPQVQEYAAALRASLNERPALLARVPSFADFANNDHGHHGAATRAATTNDGGGEDETNKHTFAGRGNRGEGSQGNGGFDASAGAAAARVWEWDSRPAVSATQSSKQQQKQQPLQGIGGTSMSAHQNPGARAWGGRQLLPSLRSVTDGGVDLSPFSEVATAAAVVSSCASTASRGDEANMLGGATECSPTEAVTHDAVRTAPASDEAVKRAREARRERQERRAAERRSAAAALAAREATRESERALRRASQLDEVEREGERQRRRWGGSG